MTTNCDRNTPIGNRFDPIPPQYWNASAGELYRAMYGVDRPLQPRRVDITKQEYICNNTEPKDHYSATIEGPKTEPKVVLVTDVAQGSALKVQVSGDHYKNAKIQPIEFIHANNIPFCEANVIKYVFRWKTKNGVKDLEKARHYIDLLIELESKNV